MFLSQAIYRGLLRRTATRREAFDKEIAVWTQGGVAAEFARTLRSEEFSTMVLPDLIEQATRDWSGRYIFFLHVPKTAGTAFRLSLTRAAGIPSIMSYDGFGTCEPHELKRLDFWPLLSGHAHIDDFPLRHRGVTTLREPRSRLLSLLRQRQQPPHKDPHSALWGDIDEGKTAWRRTLALPFETWLEQEGRPQFTMFTHGLPAEEALNGHPRRWQDIRASLSEGLKRFDACAWAHDRDGLEETLRAVTGREDAMMTVANEFRPHEYTRPVIISAESRRLLEALARDDQLLFDVAHDELGLPRLSQDEADDLFEATAKRLGFTLA